MAGWNRLALRATLALLALFVLAVVVLSVARHRAYARAEAFCAATPAGTAARDVTIRALDQSVQVRTDIEPGALVVRFPAWGPSSAVGECRMALEDGHVVAARVVRAED